MNQSPENTSDNAAFLDASVLIEVILNRANASRARELIENQSGDLYISALTAHLVVHFGKSIVDFPVLRSFLADYTVLGLEAADFEWAFMNARNRDFEDALQLAVAVRHGCSRFITFDTGVAHSYNELPSIKVTLLG